MKWSDDELQRFESFMEREIVEGSSWKDRVQRWNNEFKKDRTVSSLRGLWNRLGWGWVPKRQKASRVDSAVGRIIKPTGSSGRISQRARLRARLSRQRMSTTPEPSLPLAPVGSPMREATPTQKRRQMSEAPLSQVRRARKSHTTQKTPRQDRGHQQSQLAQSPEGLGADEVPETSDAPAHEGNMDYQLAGSLWICAKYIAMKHQTPRYLSSGPKKISLRSVHKVARHYPAASTQRPFHSTCTK